MKSKNKKILMTGNEAMAEGAIQAGCRFYAGYPITPQNEIPAYMSEHMPASGGVFIQAESELAAINMVFGAAAAGVRALTSSSSPGISLKQEGISYICGAELPAVIINVMRGGPGLGNIAPSQSDYFQATKSAGHGDGRNIVLAPSTVQECYDIMCEVFDLADKYRNPVMILGDGILGQMMEPVLISQKSKVKSQKYTMPMQNDKKKTWALTGCLGRKPNVVKSFYLKEGLLEEFNLHMQEKYRKIIELEQKYEDIFINDAEIILVAYGTMARIAKSVVKSLRHKGRKIGLIRPISLWPFPQDIFKRISAKKKVPVFLVVEMSYGQMIEDVKLAICGKARVEFIGRSGGGVPTEEAIIKRIDKLVNSS